MKKLPKISVGIPAFNEENNIVSVLKDILKQKQTNWVLKEVLVYSDGSTDETVKQARLVINPLINVYEGKSRLGKTARLSQMFQKFQGDILVMFDGDIKFSNNQVLDKMVETFKSDNVMLVGGNSRPFEPKSFFEKSVYSTFAVFDKSRKYIKQGDNVFGCTGSILAIRSKFAKELKLPKIINEDAFIYMECLKRGYTFRYQNQAVVYYKLPSNLKDYLRQVFRSNPEAVTVELERYFGNLVAREFKRPVKFYLKSIFETFIENPVAVITIVVIQIFCKPFFPVISKNYKLSWFTASSTH